MLYHDRIYGAAEITAPVLLALIQSRAVQRLQGVLQHGITALLGITSSTTRFEHSVGVMLLAQRFGAPLREQIAALLHDVSHTAFSHVIDHVWHEPAQQSYHERIKADYLATTDLPALLAQYDLNWRDFIDDAPYPILEQPSPALCADRLDYFLRDSFDLGLTTADDIATVLAHLCVHEGRIVLDNLNTARWLAETYLATNQASWANFREVGLYETTARALRTALQNGIISEVDLWSTDEALWHKLQTSPEPELRRHLQTVTPQTQFVWEERHPDFLVRPKLRTIDPHVFHAGKLALFSEFDSNFARRREQYLTKLDKAWPMQIIAGNR